MHVLMTTSPGLNHLWNLVPLGWALRSAGHDVRIASLPNFSPAVVETGLPAIAVGRPIDKSLLDTGPAPDETGGTRGGRHRFERYGRRNAQVSALLARGLRPVLAGFRPDLVVHEPAELAGPLLAQRLGVPAVHQGWGLPMHPGVTGALHRAAAGLRRHLQLAEEVAAPALIIDVCPPGYDDGTPRPRVPHQPMRYVPFNGPGAVPDWLHEPPARPRVGVTVGTVLPSLGGLPLVSRVARLVSTLDVEVVVPLRERDRGRVELPGSGVRVVDWLPFRLMADSCALIIHHGGPGTTMTALAHGTPQLALPTVFDQFRNARLIERTGVGRALAHGQLTDAALLDAVRSVLDGPQYRAAARRVAAEIASQPSPTEVVAVLERLAAAPVPVG